MNGNWIKTEDGDSYSDFWGLIYLKPERILIKVYSTQVEYVRALPIHESQKEVETTDEWSVFEYRIIPCFNLYQQLLWHREKLEVLEPKSVREEMKKIVEEIKKNYK